MSEIHPDWKFRGRGAGTNPTGRFEHTTTLPADDGWGSLDQEEPAALDTVLLPDASKGILSTNTSPDVPFDRSINPYQGCEHGCVYCFARPSHAYLNLSPGLDFESKIFFKPEGHRLLEEVLRKPGYTVDVLALGSNTDVYQPAEKKLGLTRKILEVLSAHHHPVSIVTKSSLILRDLDLLTSLAQRNLVRVFVSVTTLEGTLARQMEPRAATPDRRLLTIQALNRAGVPVGVMAAPMIPGLNDHELEAILEAASGHGADFAGYVLLRLPFEVKEVFVNWLRAQYPDRADRVLHLIRDVRGGKLNSSHFNERMKGVGPIADLLKRRFEVSCRRLGLNRSKDQLDILKFKVPPLPGSQLELFGDSEDSGRRR